MSASQTDTSDRELVVTRILNAPRELVWEAWTNPKHLIHWWGPRGFTNTFQEISIKPGGIWRFIMHGPDGQDYQNLVTFQEVIKPERLTYTHGVDTNDPEQFRTIVTFDTLGEQTKVTLRAIFPSAAERDRAVKEVGAVEGGQQTIDRLTEQVSKLQTAEPFVISRTFTAPRELVWKACTEPERMQHWWGPKGFTVKVAQLDFRPGGRFHYSMHAPDGLVMWGRFVYREITVPERILFINSFSDEQGGLTRHPLTTDPWPIEMLSTFTFTEHEGKTTLTVHWVPYNATAAELKMFNAGRPSMQGGWTGTLDKLTAYLIMAGK